MNPELNESTGDGHGGTVLLPLEPGQGREADAVSDEGIQPWNALLA